MVTNQKYFKTGQEIADNIIYSIRSIDAFKKKTKSSINKITPGTRMNKMGELTEATCQAKLNDNNNIITIYAPPLTAVTHICILGHTNSNSHYI
jgi:hypothetical protein